MAAPCNNREITGKSKRKWRADEGTRFKPGQSGNPKGRPKGSRHKLSEATLEELCADFEAGGRAAIERCRLEQPGVYLRVIASLLPKQLEIERKTPLDDFTEEELEALDDWLTAYRNGDVTMPERRQRIENRFAGYSDQELEDAERFIQSRRNIGVGSSQAATHRNH